MPELTQEGIDLVKGFEGLRLNSYLDAVGFKTIGFGHKIEQNEDIEDSITEEKATELLISDLETAGKRVLLHTDIDLNDNQYSALVSLVYNIGITPLINTLGRLLNRGDYQGAADQFLLWVHAGGKILEGLVRRRSAERKLFLTPL